MRSLVVIGNFDGVHRGHQTVLEAVARMARQRSLTPKLLTFEPHPAVTLGREPPPLLTRLPRKIELVERACPGIEVAVRAFTSEFSQQSPEAFVKQVLVDDLAAAMVMVGSNFRFGRARAGGVAELESLGQRYDFETVAEPLVSDDDGAWSSTRVRRLIADGDMRGAAEMLGRPHMLSDVVARGDQRGRTIGFPTANLVAAPEAPPPHGVYAVLVDATDAEAGGQRAIAKGVANFGVRPTVAREAARPVLEVHLFDYSGDLYGVALRVHMLARLRGEQRFADLAALQAQIARDADAARQLLAPYEPEFATWF